MATLRPRGDRQVDVRAELAAKLRRLAAQYATLPGADRWVREAERVEAGEPWEGAVWELHRAARAGLDPHQRVRLEPDGTVTPLR